MSRVLQRLEQGTLLLDGGLGTELIARGLRAGQAPEEWLLSHPDRIAGVHRAYAGAGADIIQTCTFGATPPKLAASSRLAGRCAEINARAAELARGACGPRTLVSGDVGPTGLLFPPLGQATEEQLQEAFAEQVAVLCGAGVDLLCLETMYDLREARAALSAALTSGLPVFASMVFDPKKRGFFTIMGDALVPSLQALADQGAAVVGFNCSVESEVMLQMVREASAAVQAPLMAQPNAGQPRATPGGVVYDARPGPFAADLLQMVAAGARVVGGCCGSTPEFIRAARGALDRG
jgi:methionine synthase I (cobalamin-dependent)